jgi:hypothetical protein
VPRGRDPERLHPANQRVTIARLDDQVNMRALNAQVNDVKRTVELPRLCTHVRARKRAFVVRERRERCLFDRTKYRMRA